MKVVVKDYLNVRVGKPSVNAPCYQYLAPGSEIEVDGRIYQGDSYENIDTWLKDQAGNYYWRGGFEKGLNTGLKVVEPSENLINYRDILKTAMKLPSTFGSGINVAIIDSGVNTSHRDIGPVSQTKSFVDGESATSDVWGHGTLMAGLIGGRSSRQNGIIGIAPKCNLYNYKVVNDQGATNMVALKNCLNYIITQQSNLGVHVINLSISVPDLALINSEINSLSALGVRIVVAGGNEDLLKLNLVRLLAQNTNVVSVGTIKDKDYFGNGGSIPKLLSCFYFNQKLWSTATAGNYDDVSGDSVYTAITTALIANSINAPNGSKLNNYLFNRALFNPTDISPFN
jgi:subtilisin family serine protease